jgi:cation:H+ antiporter
MEFVLLILGIIGLVLGTNLIISGSLNIAEHYKISHIFIGLTILAVGTDLPELVVDINGALHRLSGIETSGLIVGETLGTALSQIGLALGIIGLFGTSLFLTKKELVREGSMLLGSVLLLFFLAYDGMLTPLDGGVMLLVYAFYFVMLYISEKGPEPEVKKAPPMNVTWSIMSLLGGFVVLIFASDMVINNALAIALTWGLAQSFVGAVIVGIGTSLPEIAVSVGAIAKKSPRLSIGNLLGSNIFDVLFTLGVGTTISGFIVEDGLLWFDLPYLFFTSLLVVLFFLTGQKLTKKEAVVLLVVYAAYIVLKVLGF